jgi:Flp pilus assembly protein TadD
VSHYRDAWRVRPEDYQAVHLSGAPLATLGRHDEALEAARQALKLADAHLDLNPDDARAWYLSASALMRLGQHEQAMERARRASAIDPGDPGVLYNVGCVYALAGSGQEALNHLEKAIENGFGHRDWLENDSDWDSLRDQPRFQALLRKL